MEAKLRNLTAEDLERFAEAAQVLGRGEEAGELERFWRDNRDLGVVAFLAIVLTGLLLFGWDAAMKWFYPNAAMADRTAERASAAANSGQPVRTREGGLTDPGAAATERRDLATALASGRRVPIAAPEIAGSIDLVGARIDDLTLTAHRETVDADSDPVRLLSPAGTPAQHFAQFGWIGTGVRVPDANTVWQASGGPLAPGKPVTLTWDNGQGQRFGIEFSVDDKYLITAKQTVANARALVAMHAQGETLVVLATDPEAPIED